MAASEDADASSVPAEPTALRRRWQLSALTTLSAAADDPISLALDEVFGAFHTSDTVAHPIHLESRSIDEERLELLCDGIRVAKVEPRGLAPFLEGSVLGLAMRRMDQRMVLHAASMEIEGVGLALLGEKGSGKSTLSLLTALSGHRFCGDELLPIDPETKCAVSFPKAATLKRGAFRIFAKRPEHEDPVRGPVRYHLPPVHARPEATMPLRALVFPSFSSEAEPAALSELNAEEVALPLVQQVFGGLERHEASLGCITRLASLPCRRLLFSDGRAAVEQLEALARELNS